jgi:hypothetical protein
LDYVAKFDNGITQHSAAWFTAKLFTVGGSQIATIVGKHPFSSMYQLIGSKIGIVKFVSNIKVQWGNLFENVIKIYVEYDKHTEIVGDEMFIPGPPNTSYSPDGLGVINMIYEECDSRMTTLSSVNTRALFEFKCPYSRIPDGKVPKYYVPQVKYGLDMIPVVDIGVFVEAVFRRCSWDQLGYNPDYDRKLVAKSSGNLPLAYSVIGFYLDRTKFDTLSQSDAISKLHKKLIKQYTEVFEVGHTENDFASNDLGDSDPELFETIMHCFDQKILDVYYGTLTYTQDNFAEDDATRLMNTNLELFEKKCRDNDYVNFGILPWKLFRIDYNYIEREAGYVARYKDKIDEIIDVVRECCDPKNERIKMNIFNSYISKSLGGFSE